MRPLSKTTLAIVGIAWCATAFAGTDPVPVDTTTGANFNRYAYANNNPYTFVDPDGRAAKIVHHPDGIRVEMPTRFTGAGANDATIAHVTAGFESQGGVYKVNGAPTRVEFKVVPITATTPARLRNEVRMFEGKTDHPKGVSYADKVGGTRVALSVTNAAFAHGSGPHELNHLAGAKDAYLRDANGNKIPNPARMGDIMNHVPGRMTDTVVNQILQDPNNRHEGKTK